VKAVVRNRFGSPDALEVEDVEKPELTDDGVLVRVRAASLNRGDWYELTGTPYVARVSLGLRKPKSNRLGTDFAGTVQAVGKDVTGFQPGDAVFGARDGALAEFVNVRNAVAPKPANVTFEEAAAVPVAAVTALQGLRDKGQIQPGQNVLVNGASGGVGTFAVQIAEALGAEVTGVCSTRNVDLVRSLGADHVVDYTEEDFTRSGRRYDLMLDVAGGRSWSECNRVLNRHATLVLVGGPMRNRLIGPLGHIVRARLAGLLRRRNVVFFIAKLNKPEMADVRELLEAGQMKPVVERRYELSEIAAALQYVGEGHPQGKIVITITD
jgi:NADPH:quinone reductase-like Zn-dependent oxidoreductase